MSFITRKLSTVLNNDILQKISNMAEDIEEIKGMMNDMKEAIVSNKEKIVKNSNTIADVSLLSRGILPRSLVCQGSMRQGL